jgi:hypothetical protein
MECRVVSWESLERRSMLAGNVVASSVDGVLTLTGDDLSNAFEIVREAPFIDVEGAWILRITGLDGTTINGHAEALFPMNNQHVRIDTRGGDDSVVVAGVIVRSLDVDLGAGDDRLVLRSSRVRSDVWIDAGTGDDRIELRDLVAQASVQVTGGLGRDRVSFSRVSVGEALSIEDYSGAGRVTVNRTTVAGTMRIDTGNAIDRIELQSSTFTGDASIRTRGQDDSIRVRGTVFEGTSPIEPGEGSNTLDREVILEWDFREGAQGWAGGFADYYALQDPEVDSGMRVIPDTTPQRRGFLLTGQNDSDDLFMYLTRRISGNEGLVANTSYHVTIEISFYSNRVAGVRGQGGPPAEGVYVKLGGSTTTPTLVFDARSTNYRLNIDIGNQSNSGTDATVSGTIENGDVAENDGRHFLPVVRSMPTPLAVTSDPSGRISLLAGFDSGFQGRTTVFVSAISARLTPT